MTKKFTWEAAGAALDERLAQAMVTFGTLGLSIVPCLHNFHVTFGNYPNIELKIPTIIVFGLIFLRGTVLTWKRDSNVKQLKESEASARRAIADYAKLLPMIFQTQLINLAQSMQLTTEDRISLYAHDGSQFLMLGRFSENETIKHSGRKTYPHNEGCIGKAWAEGEHHITGLPDPKVDMPAYVDSMKQYGLSEETINGLKMKSRAYYAIQLRREEGAVAVLVIESTNPDNIKPDKWKNGSLSQPTRTRLSAMLEALRPLWAKPSDALNLLGMNIGK